MFFYLLINLSFLNGFESRLRHWKAWPNVGYSVGNLKPRNKVIWRPFFQLWIEKANSFPVHIKWAGWLAYKLYDITCQFEVVGFSVPRTEVTKKGNHGYIRNPSLYFKCLHPHESWPKFRYFQKYWVFIISSRLKWG